MSVRFNFGGADSRATERAAAEWFVRHQQILSREEEAEFEAWLRRDRRHAEIYGEISETSQLLEQLREPAPAGTISFESQRDRRARLGPWHLPALIAAAAVVAMLWLWRVAAPAPASAFKETVATAVDGLRKLDLPDGSVVELNVGSAVDVAFTANERRVTLVRGEAHFTVAHNTSRPFIVSANGVAVRAVGTAFNVRLAPAAVEVLVTEGKVQVSDVARGESLLQPAPASAAPPAGPPLLVAGQAVEIPVTRLAEMPRLVAPAPVEAAEIERRLAWKERRLEFSDMSLADAVAEFNRHSTHRLVIADDSLKAMRFGGSFSLHGQEAFVELLEQSFGVVAERRGNETILRRKH